MTTEASVNRSFPIGLVLHDNYRIERLLGQGGMASVFEVTHLRLPRRFALKVLTSDSAKSNEFILRFRREAEILASLDHPNLVNVVDWNMTPCEQPYLVMELLSGEDLSAHLRNNGALPPQVALCIFTQIAAAIELVHQFGITHRDLKPANIFLCKNGSTPYYVKVLDFGIAKSTQHAAELLTDQLSVMGTPAYMAPEQARGNIEGIDHRSDQFSLGLILYEMLCGRPAFHRPGEPVMSTLCRVLTDDPEPLANEAINHVVMRALQKNPDDRYSTLSEMVSAVTNSIQSLTGINTSPNLTTRHSDSDVARFHPSTDKRPDPSLPTDTANLSSGHSNAAGLVPPVAISPRDPSAATIALKSTWARFMRAPSAGSVAVLLGLLALGQALRLMIQRSGTVSRAASSLPPTVWMGVQTSAGKTNEANANQKSTALASLVAPKPAVGIAVSNVVPPVKSTVFRRTPASSVRVGSGAGKGTTTLGSALAPFEIQLQGMPQEGIGARFVRDCLRNAVDSDWKSYVGLQIELRRDSSNRLATTSGLNLMHSVSFNYCLRDLDNHSAFTPYLVRLTIRQTNN